MTLGTSLSRGTPPKGKTPNFHWAFGVCSHCSHCSQLFQGGGGMEMPASEMMLPSPCSFLSPKKHGNSGNMGTVHLCAVFPRVFIGGGSPRRTARGGNSGTRAQIGNERRKDRRSNISPGRDRVQKPSPPLTTILRRHRPCDARAGLAVRDLRLSRRRRAPPNGTLTPRPAVIAADPMAPGIAFPLETKGLIRRRANHRDGHASRRAGQLGPGERRWAAHRVTPD